MNFNDESSWKIITKNGIKIHKKSVKTIFEVQNVEILLSFTGRFQATNLDQSKQHK